MITVMALCYIGCVLLVFKVIKLKVSPISVGVAVLLGVLLLGGIVIGWKFSAPMSGRIIVKRNVIPLLAGQDSKELITKIHVPADQPVKKGEVLFEVDSRPSQYRVDSLTAELAASKQKVMELQAAVDVAKATIELAKASAATASAQLATSQKSHELNPGAVAELQLTIQEQKYESEQAAVDQAIANEKVAESTLANARATLKATEAELDTAKLNLQQCQVRAPADGHIMSWQAVEGTMTTTVITSAQGTFMDMSETVVGAVFPQNLLSNVQPGDKVEIAFRSLPGRITTGKVDQALEYTGEGQFEPSGVLPVAKDLDSQGLLVVRIVLDDQKLAQELPLGGAGTVAIYTQAGRPFHIISKITLRIKAWMYFVPI